MASAIEGVEGGRTLSHTDTQMQVANQAHAFIVAVELGSNGTWSHTVAVERGFILVEALLALSETPASGTACATQSACGCCSIVELAIITTLDTSAIHLDQLSPACIAQVNSPTAPIATGITFQASEASVQVVQWTLSHTVPIQGLEVVRAPQTVGGSP